MLYPISDFFKATNGYCEHIKYGSVFQWLFIVAQNKLNPIIANCLAESALPVTVFQAFHPESNMTTVCIAICAFYPIKISSIVVNRYFVLFPFSHNLWIFVATYARSIERTRMMILCWYYTEYPMVFQSLLKMIRKIRNQ